MSSPRINRRHRRQMPSVPFPSAVMPSKNVLYRRQSCAVPLHTTAVGAPKALNNCMWYFQLWCWRSIYYFFTFLSFLPQRSTDWLFILRHNFMPWAPPLITLLLVVTFQNMRLFSIRNLTFAIGDDDVAQLAPVFRNKLNWFLAFAVNKCVNKAYLLDFFI